MKNRALYIYAILSFFMSIFLVMFDYQFDVHLSFPAHYTGDGLLSSMLVKTIIETGWFIHNPYLSAPLTFNFLDFPLVETTHLLLIKFFALFSSNYAVVLNLFYLATFPAIATSAFFVLVGLGLRYPIALLVSILYAFMPYHFARGEGHLFLASYYSVPIFIWFAYLVFHGKPFCGEHKLSKTVCFFYLVLSVIIASSGFYYAFFGVYLILIAGLISAINHKKWVYIINACIFTLIISATIGANLIPNVMHWKKYGKNTAVGMRAAYEPEMYGLKLAQMLLPGDNHRIHAFAKIKSKYEVTAIIPGEGRDSTMGIVGGTGFLLLISSLLFRTKFLREENIYFAAVLSLAAFLLATRGGLSSLFSYLISPEIRAYNRISIFLSFLGLFAFFFLLQKYAKRFKSPLVLYILASLVFYFSWLDCVRFNIWIQPETKKIYLSDQQYVQSIENVLPKQAMIFQLPFVSFPEVEEGYVPIKTYLHSHSLRWSYPAFRGRSVEKWQQKVSDLAPAKMLDALSVAGFKGISLDRQLHPEAMEKVEKALTFILGKPTIISENKQFIFYDLRPYATALKKRLNSKEWNRQLNELNNDLQVSIAWKNGCYNLEHNQETNWHWCDKKARLVAENLYDHDIRAHIYFILKTGNSASAMVNFSGLVNEEAMVDQRGLVFSKELMLKPGKNTLDLRSDAKPLLVATDPRHLYLQIFEFKAEVR